MTQVSIYQYRCTALSTQCQWAYTGLGMDYQLLAGPAFVAVFTVSGVLFGAASDALSSAAARARLLGVAVVLFSAATTATAFSQKYWHLVASRMLLAAGESACSPVGVSVVAEIFEVRSRGLAAGVFHWGVYFGYGLSYAVGVHVTE